MPLPRDADIRKRVEPAFRALRRAPGLEGSLLRFTLPLPDPWPDPRGATFFAYGTALPMSSRAGRLVVTVLDAALVSRPFATISVVRGAEPVVRLLSSELTLAGTQGIGPASPKERELWRRSEEVLAEVEAGAAPLSDTARRFFAQMGRGERRDHGLLARCAARLPGVRERGPRSCGDAPLRHAREGSR